MRTSSEEYSTIIRAPLRQWTAQLLVNEESYDGEIETLAVNMGCCGEKPIPGAIYIPYFEGTLRGALIDKGDVVEIKYGLLVGDAYEFLSFGTLTVTDSGYSDGEASFRAVGDLAIKGSDNYKSALSFPVMVSDVLAEVITQTGWNITIDSGMDTTLEIANDMSDECYRDVVGYLAGIMGGYVTENYEGKITIRKYKRSGTDRGYTNNMYQTLPEFGTFTVTGLRVTSDDSSTLKYESGIPNIEAVNPYVTQNTFSAASVALTGLTFNPAEVEMTMGDPRIEAGDRLLFRDDTGDYYILALQVRHEFFGGVSTTVSCVVNPQQAAAVPSGSVSHQTKRAFSSLRKSLEDNVSTLNVRAGEIEGNVSKLTTDYGDLNDKVDTKVDNEAAITIAESVVKQTSAGFEIRVTELEGKAQKAATAVDLNDLKTKVDAHFTFNEDGLSIYGTKGSNTAVHAVLDSDSLDFVGAGGQIVASFGTEKTVVNKIFQMGGFQFIIQNDGSVDEVWAQ